MVINKKNILALVLIGLTVSSQPVEAHKFSTRRCESSAASPRVRIAELADEMFVAVVAIVAPVSKERITVRVPDDLRIDKIVARKLAELEEDPTMAIPFDKELKGFVKVTSGDYRIVLRWSGINELTVVDFGARGGIYEPLARRLSESMKQTRLSGVKSEVARQVEESGRILLLREGVVCA